MKICSPDGETIIETDDYKFIHACSKNKTHIDFYMEPPVPGERGQPDVIFTYKTKRERDDAFSFLTERLDAQYL